MTTTPSFRIAPVRGGADLADTIGLIRAYAASLPIDLAYQGFEAEMRAMPGKYAPPAGELLLARAADGTPLGCVGMRPLDPPGVCEMKRLWVAPAGRGRGLGRALGGAILTAARAAGHAEMCLDTLPTMTEALGLYRALGFEPTAAYYDTPIAGTVFLRRRLRDEDGTLEF